MVGEQPVLLKLPSLIKPRPSRAATCDHLKYAGPCLLNIWQLPSTKWPLVEYNDTSLYVYPLANLGSLKDVLEAGSSMGCRWNYWLFLEAWGPYAKWSYPYQNFFPFGLYHSGYPEIIGQQKPIYRFQPPLFPNAIFTEVSDYPPSLIPDGWPPTG